MDYFRKQHQKDLYSKKIFKIIRLTFSELYERLRVNSRETLHLLPSH